MPSNFLQVSLAVYISELISMPEGTVGTGADVKCLYCQSPWEAQRFTSLSLEPTEGKRERVQEGASSCQSVKSHTWLLCLPEVLRQDTGRS